MNLKTTFALLALALAAVPAARAQDKVADLERKVEALAGEIERLKLGEAAEPDLKSALGLGPAASKIYQKSPKRVSVGGYGETLYENFQPKKQNGTGAGKRDQIDALRAIIYVGYKFSDRIMFNSEIEFEHSGARVSGGGARGEVSVEMAALDFKPFGDRLGFRAGTLLMPVGLINEVHEPTTFHGAKRPSVESNVIPTTWRENGAGVFGEWGPASYRSYVVSGLQAGNDTNVSGFTASSGLRSGRSSGGKSFIEDAAWVTRLDVSPAEGFLFGGSFYVGEADQSQLRLPSVPVSLWETHAKLAWRGAEFKALYAQVRVGNVDSLNALQGNARVAAGVTGNGSVGSDMFGGYLEAAYDILTLWSNPNGQSLTPFARYERYDTQAGVPHAWAKNGSNSRVEYTVGAGYKPLTQVVLKADHQFLRDQSQTGVGQTNLAIGYIF